jgi:methylmalonyl-CoA mutase, N-terminal domain
VRSRDCDRDARLADLDPTDSVVDCHRPEVVALLEVGGDLGHHILGHLGVGLVFEVEDGLAPGLSANGSQEGRDRPGALVHYLAYHRVERERLLGDSKRAARDRRDQRHLVAVGELAPGVRVLAVDGVEQPVRLVAQAEGRPDIGHARDAGELALRVAGPLPQPGKQPHLDSHRIPSFPMATTRDGRETDSGIEVKPVYTEKDVAGLELELPGEFPFTRGPYPDMYRGRPWTIRQYAGFASAEETNARFRYLLERGQHGLSVAFDLPTQLGYDSDDERAAGEVGRTGVAIDSLADMELLFDGIPLGEVSTSMTINAPASLLLLLYELVGDQQGVPGERLRGTVQNDILKEYIARGNYIFPPRPSMRLTTDLFAYCAERLPSWNTISISGYHIREAGSTAVQELAFTLANGIAYCQAAVAAGLSPDEFGERLSFFFNAHNHFFQEVAKFRAARRLWASIMRDRFGVENPKAQALRFHAQTGGSTLTAQQPENNIARVTVQALSAICGGAQSIHTNSFDEALALPSEHAARIALRTQQILAHEGGGTDTADPLGGAYFIEELTNELEQRARELIERVDELGGAVAAIEQGFVQREIEQAAFAYTQQVEAGEKVIVGVNKYTEDDTEQIELHRIDPEAERRQLERTARVREERNPAEASAALRRVRESAQLEANLLPPMREALRARCTVGEICNVLREEFGMYDAQRS